MVASYPPIRRIVVVGFGLMGRGIATLFARAGLDVVAVDPCAAEKAKAGEGVGVHTDLPAETPDLVIEAVYEEMEIKTEVFRKVEAAYGPATIIASNTSGLPLQSMAATLTRPQRFLGMHYFTPADVSPLVEVVKVAETADAAVDRVVEVLAKAGREAIVLSRPIVGYLWNRLQHAILHEAYHLVENGVVRPEDVDKVAKRLLGPRFCVTGLIEGKDVFNLEAHVHAQHSIVPHLHHSGKPCEILDRKLERRHFGVRSSKGFYDWGGRDPDAVLAATARRLERLTRFLEEDLEKAEPPLPPKTSLPPD